MDAWSLIFENRKRVYCSSCGCDFYERNKEKKHWVYSGEDVVACGKLLTYLQYRKQLRDWDKKHPKKCRSCGGCGYHIIGGTESEVCHCREPR